MRNNRTFLPQVMYSPDFESSGGSAPSLDFEEEGLDAPTGNDFENNDNSELVVDLDFEPDADGNQEPTEPPETPEHLPDEGDSDDGNSDEPDSTETDGDEENSADDAQGDLNSLYLRAGQLGLSSEDVAQFADKGPDTLDAYLSGLEVGGTGQQQDGQGGSQATADTFKIEPFTMDFGEEKGEYEDALMKNLDGLTEHVNEGLEKVMGVATGFATEIMAILNGQAEKSEETAETKKTEKTTAKLTQRKVSASPKSQKKVSKSVKGQSPQQRAADAINEKYPGEFGA